MDNTRAKRGQADPNTILDWVEDQYATVRGLQIRYRRTGDPGSYPPLVLINGIGAPLEMWAPLVEELTTRDILVFDLPGSGRSSTPTWPVQMSWFADVVEVFLGKIGLGVVDVLGFSFGGAVAQELAIRHGARVRRLILASTTPGLPAIPGNIIALAMASTPLRYFDQRLGEFMVPRLAGGQSLRDHELLVQDLWRRQLEPPTLWGYTLQLIAISTWSAHLFLPSITAPTLVLHGSEDPLCPVINARWMAKLIPDSEFVDLPGAGHLVLLDEPAKAAGSIKSFLKAQSYI